MKTKLLTFLVLHLGLAAVVAQPVITTQPQDQTALAGTTVTFFCEATGTPPLTYQWRSYNSTGSSFTNIPGATDATLTLPDARATTRLFAVVVTDFTSLSVTSAPLAKLIVVSPPRLTRPLFDQAGMAGDNFSLHVTTTGTGPLTYQWFFDGKPLAGANRSSISFPKLQSSDAGPYFAVISNAYGMITSQVARLSVGVPNVIIDWNDALIPVFKGSSLPVLQAVRAVSLMHLAQFEAVNAVRALRQLCVESGRARSLPGGGRRAGGLHGAHQPDVLGHNDLAFPTHAIPGRRAGRPSEIGWDRAWSGCRRCDPVAPRWGRDFVADSGAESGAQTRSVASHPTGL